MKIQPLATIALLVSCLALDGCAVGGWSNGRTYHSWDSAYKYGYSDTQLSETVYRVSYSGRDLPQNECDDYALMRAAELANQKGYPAFRVLNESQSQGSQSYYVPGVMQTTGRIVGTGSTARISATSISSGFVGSYQRGVSTFTIELLSQISSSEAFNAKIIWNSLAQKYGISEAHE